MPKVPYNKRNDGRYYKQFVVGVNKDRKRLIKTLYSRKGESWQEFDKRVREFKNNLEKGRVILKDITFGECIALWLKTQIHLCDTTLNTYKSHLRKTENLQNLKLRDLKPFHFRLIYEYLYNEGYNGILNRLPPIINNILDFAVDNDFVLANVHKKVKVPKLKIGKR